MSWSFEVALGYVRAMGATPETETAQALTIAEGGCGLFVPPDDDDFRELWSRAAAASGHDH